MPQPCAAGKPYGTVKCAICKTNKRGAFKPTEKLGFPCRRGGALTDCSLRRRPNEWAHLVCGIWLPETWIGRIYATPRWLEITVLLQGKWITLRTSARELATSSWSPSAALTESSPRAGSSRAPSAKSRAPACRSVRCRPMSSLTGVAFQSGSVRLRALRVRVPRTVRLGARPACGEG